MKMMVMIKEKMYEVSSGVTITSSSESMTISLPLKANI